MKVKDNKTKMVSFRVNQTDYNKMKLKAGLYANGNLSKWIIYTAMNHKTNK
jgi:hypothetical protein